MDAAHQLVIPNILGKSSPRVIADLKLHDPLSLDAYDPFLRPPLSFQKRSFDLPPLDPPPESCHHEFSIKPDQTHTAESQYSLPTPPVKKAAGICQHCRWHVEVSIQFAGDGTGTCPKETLPLHFFVMSRLPRTEANERKEIFTFQCTGCSAVLEIVYRPPRIDPAYFGLLIDPEKLRYRYETALQSNPDRRGFEQQPGIKVLEALVSYLTESLVPTREAREIPCDNKRFMTSFGQDCDAFLSWLNFVKVPQVLEDDDTIAEHESWRLPTPPARNPFVEGARCLVEDVKEEVLAKIRQYPEREVATLRNRPPPLQSLDTILYDILGCTNYPIVTSRLRKLDLSGDEFYSGLGAISDFSDDLVLFCFKQQVEKQPNESAYFFDCLAGIANKRETDDMAIAIGMLASQGYVSQEDTQQAYRYLGFQPDEIPLLADEQILGSFNARLDSSPRRQETELREKLRIVGRARGSSMLISAAENDFRTARQALQWLDPTYDGTVKISDDHVVALAASKRSDLSGQMDLCKKAVGLIATERNSETLRLWVREGSTIGDVKEEEISAAYRYFGINDRTAQVDLDVLEFYALDFADDPVKAAEAAKHFKVIYDLKNGSREPEGTDFYDRPVGLENMGNTCYLNCLLQFLYVVRPLREIIFNFDQHKLNTDDPAYEPKRVDSILVPKLETVEAQRFVTELRSLFRDMATNSRSTVRPTWDLAKLALKRTAISGPARRSTIGGDLPLLKSPTRVEAPSFPSSSTAPANRPYIHTTNSSEVTLIDSVPKTPEDEDHVMVLDGGDAEKGPISSDSPVDIGADPMDPEAMPLLQPLHEASPPSRPPPIPPRPIGPVNKPDAEKAGWKDESSKREAEAAAQQQDVVESMGYALDKIQYSIKNDIPIARGKFTDTVNQLFYGNTVWRYMKSKIPDMAEPFSTINIPLSEKPKNVSAGLDNAFTIEDVEFEGKTTKRFRTITQPPPVFQIYFQRQEYDATRGDAVVLKHHIQLEEVIYLDRFMTLADQELHGLRERSWKLDSRLSKLNNRRKQFLSSKSSMQAPDLLDATWEFVSSHPELLDPDDPNLAKDLELEAKARRATVVATEQRIEELETQRAELFAAHRQHAYKLAAVFVHRGQGGSMGGHYWIYIFDFKAAKWRRYEDRDVRDVADPEEEIFRQKDPELQGAPYFVVYVKEEATEEVVDALWRMKPEADTEMADVGAVETGDSKSVDVPVEETEKAPEAMIE